MIDTQLLLTQYLWTEGMSKCMNQLLFYTLVMWRWRIQFHAVKNTQSCRLYTHEPMWDIFPGNSHNMLSIYSFCCDLCFVHVPKRKITAHPFLFLYSNTCNYIFKTKLEAGIRCVLCVYACLHVLTDLNFHSQNLCNFTLCMLYTRV